MKKLTALMLAFVFIFGNCYQTMADSALTSEKDTLLVLTGIIEEKADLDRALTKGEFAQMLAKIAFELNSDVKNYSGNAAIYDVPEESKYYDAVSALYSREYVVTDKFGCFYPDKMLSANDAYEMIMRTAGYSEKTLPSGTSFSNYALKKGIAKGVSFGENGEITLNNAYTMIYNMLKCDITDLKNIKYDTSDNKLVYMSVRLGLYEISGIVTDDGRISMYGDSQISEDEISVDGGDVLINKTGRNDLFGLNILGYFYEDKQEREYVLLAASARESKNRITEIYSKNIMSYENRTYSYLQDEFASTEKRIKIPKDAVIVYNGRTLRLEDSFDNEMFIPNNGIVTLYDNDADGNVEIVRIEEYITEVVELVNINKETIYVKNERPFYDLSDKKYEIYDIDGQKLELSSMIPGSVISVMESLDKEHCKIIVSVYSQTEKVTSFVKSNGDEAGYILTSSGGKYILSDYAEQYYSRIEINTTYNFVFDMFDNVAALTKNIENLDWRFGYLVWIRQNEDADDEEYFAKIYDQDGVFNTYTLNKRVTVINSDDSVNKYKPSAASANLNYSGIIRFKLNVDDLLTNIELPYTSGKKPSKDDRLYCIVDTVTDENKNDYYVKIQGQNVNYGGATVFTNKTSVFVVPEDKSEYEDYELGNYSSFSNGEYKSLYAYGTNYKSRNAVCVCLTDTGGSGTAITNEYPETVLKVTYAYEEKKNMPVYVLECLDRTGKNVTRYMEEEVYENEVKCIGAGNTQPVKIGVGDMIYIQTDASSYITKAVIAYDADQYVTDERGKLIKGSIAGTQISYYNAANTLCNPFIANDYKPGNPGSANSWKFNGGNIKIFSGWVYSYEDGYLLITNQNPAYGFNHDLAKKDGAITEAVYYSASISTTVSANGKGRLTGAKTVESDIRPYTVYGEKCSRVVLTKRVYDDRTICIINED